MELPRPEVIQLLKTIHLFNTLSDEELDWVVDRIESFPYEQGQYVYRAGDAADGFYIVYSGAVQLSFDLPEGPAVYGELIARDYFGEESLSINLKRVMDASCSKPAVLLRMSAKDLVELAESIPALAERLDLVQRSFDLLMRVDFDWLAEGEVVYLITRRHPMFLLIKLILPALLLAGGGIPLAYLWLFKSASPAMSFLLLAIVLVAAGGWGVWALVDWSNDYSLLTNRRILNTQKVVLMYENRQEVPLDAVLSYEMRRDQWGRWLNYGSIFIRTYTGTVELRQVPTPDLIVNMLQRQRERMKIVSEADYRQKVRQRLRQRLGNEPAPEETAVKLPDQPPPSETFEPGPLQFALANLFRLRYEEGGVITYWTHWWMLIRRIWAPSLVLIALFLLAALSAVGIFPMPWTTAFLLAGGFGLVAFGWWAYDFVDWRNDRYIVSFEQLVDLYKKPLGQEQRRTAPIRNIQTIEYERQGIVGLVLNFGTVYIRIGNTEFTFNNVFNPSEVQRELFQRLMELNQAERKREQERTERQISEWIEDYHELFGGDSPSEPFYPDPGFR